MTKAKHHLFKTQNRQENKTKVIFLLCFDLYKTDNYFKGTKFVMEWGRDLGEQFLLIKMLLNACVQKSSKY